MRNPTSISHAPPICTHHVLASMPIHSIAEARRDLEQLRTSTPMQILAWEPPEPANASNASGDSATNGQATPLRPDTGGEDEFVLVQPHTDRHGESIADSLMRRENESRARLEAKRRELESTLRSTLSRSDWQRGGD